MCRLLEEGRGSELGLVVLDEIHMIGERERGFASVCSLDCFVPRCVFLVCRPVVELLLSLLLFAKAQKKASPLLQVNHFLVKLIFEAERKNICIAPSLCLSHEHFTQLSNYVRQ